MTNISSGFILINKKSGPTSHDVVDQLRKITGIKKIGHAGTLDPFASGLLIMAIGRESTRKIDQFSKKDKTYIADLFLGATTNTHDREGEIVISKNFEKPEKNKITEILETFVGEQDQIPPMFSAKKVGGKKLYDLARKGVEIERKPSRVNIKKINLIEYNFPKLKIEVECSSGTYIRSLAYDIGGKLGTGAYLEELKRTAIDKYSLDKALDIKDLASENWERHLFVL